MTHAQKNCASGTSIQEYTMRSQIRVAWMFCLIFSSFFRSGLNVFSHRIAPVYFCILHCIACIFFIRQSWPPDYEFINIHWWAPVDASENMSQSLQVYSTEDYAYISCPWDDWPLCLSVWLSVQGRYLAPACIVSQCLQIKPRTVNSQYTRHATQWLIWGRHYVEMQLVSFSPLSPHQQDKPDT